MAMQFRKAQRKYGKLRAAIGSPSGGGKTTQALLLAYGLVGPEGTIGLVDTERESADLYAGDVGPKKIPIEFQTLPLSAPYTPERYIEAIKAAEVARIDCLIIDSMTHEWSGIGGALELVDQVAKSSSSKNSWAAWNIVTPRHRKFVDAILAYPGHVICTIRSKTETDQVEENGRKKVVKLGMKNEQRDGTDYEFTLVFEIDHESHYARATKDRTRLFPDPVMIDDDSVGRRLRDWLESGAKPAEEQLTDPQMKAIREAQTVEALKAVFASAWQSAKGRGDRASADAYKAAYDVRLEEIASKAQPSGGDEESGLRDDEGPPPGDDTPPPDEVQ